MEDNLYAVVPTCRFLGSFRNQVGAVMEVLKAAEYTAHVAVLTRSSASGVGPGAEGGGAPREVATPHLDRLGDLEQLGSLECASLPQVGSLLEAQHGFMHGIANVHMLLRSDMIFFFASHWQ